MQVLRYPSTSVHLGRFSSVDFHSWSLFGNWKVDKSLQPGKESISVPTSKVGFCILSYRLAMKDCVHPHMN